jgi:hypothetical protein
VNSIDLAKNTILSKYEKDEYESEGNEDEEKSFISRK